MERLSLTSDHYQTTESVALLILTLGEDISAEVLKGFSHEEIRVLTHAMSKLKDIQANDALKSIIGFFNDYSKHSGILGGTRQYITNVLSKTLDGNMARDLVSEIYGDEVRTHAEQLAWIPADILANDLRKEHINMQALLIAHLPLEYASRVLEQYSTDESAEVMYQISQTQVLTAGIAETLKDLVTRCRENYRSGGNQTIKGTKVVADIINRFNGDKAEIFEYLSVMDETLAGKVQDAMYDFFTIFSQDQETIDAINNEVNIQLWAYAMKGLNEDNRGFILNSMPNRLALQLKETIEQLGAVPLSQVEAARTEILTIVRRLHTDGKIQLSFSSEARLT